MNVTPNSAAAPPQAASGSRDTLLALIGVNKRYGETTALRDVSLTFSPGRIHGLVGENGAGKSTLVKIMSGLEAPDSGDLNVEGSPVTLRSPQDAFRLGFSTVYQELTLAPKLTVGENLLMGWQAVESRRRYRSHRAVDRFATTMMDDWELEGIPSYVPVQRLTLGDQQRLEIVRACARRPRLLILDEPTAALGAPAVKWLRAQLAKLIDAGTCIVYISHRLEEIRSSCSDITVLRDGRCVGAVDDPQGVPEREIVRMIAGREIERLEAGEKVAARPGAKVRLEARSLTVGRVLSEVSLKLSEGEILGVAALEGSGQRELFLTLFGATRPDGGSLSLDGQPARFRTPRDAVAAGVALVPEDRKSGGLLLESSNTSNVVLASLKKFQRFGFFRSRAARSLTVGILQSLAVKYSSPDERVGALSGGNQQKVVLAKWLAAESQIFLMYDPTRGVDPATKIDMYTRIRELANEGRSILLYSSEMEEVLYLSTRILVMYRGRIVREFANLPVADEEVVSAMLGLTGGDSS